MCEVQGWSTKNYFIIIFFIYASLLGLIILDKMGLQIPLIRQVVGFLFLAFVPGSLILKFMRLHKVDTVDTLLYLVGLSLAFLMFIGLFMNTLYPFFGIMQPISVTSLMITVGVFMAIMCILIHLTNDNISNGDTNYNKNINRYTRLNLKFIAIKKYLVVLQLPFLSIFGTYLFNFHSDNRLLLIFLIVISLVPIIVSFHKFSERFQAFTIFIISVSLLYHTSLISTYLWGTDVHREYYLSRLVVENTHWDSTIHSNVNAMLSIVMMAPIFSNACGMSLTWVFKVIYPLLYSIVPLGLYRIYQKQTSDKIAFLSAFFFTSGFIFYMELPQLARQEIAEIFFVLLVLLTADKGIHSMEKAILSIIFAFSMIISHYGISYIFMFFLVFVWGSLFLEDKWNKVKQKVKHPITATFVMLYTIFAATWYIHVSSSSAFNTIVRIGDHVASSIFTDFLNPTTAEGMNFLVSSMASPLQEITKILYLITQFFITVGIIIVLLKRDETRFGKSYMAFSMACYALCLASIALPHFSSNISTTRMYHISLLFLSPFCIIGGSIIFKELGKVFNQKNVKKNSLKFVSVFLSVFLIFNSGVIYELLKDPSGPIFICKERIIEHGDSQRKAALFYTYNTFEQDVHGIKWLSKMTSPNTMIYSDRNGYRIHSYGMVDESRILFMSNTTNIHQIVNKNTFLYLGHTNVIEGILIYRNTSSIGIGAKRLGAFNTSHIYNSLEKQGKLYSNGGCEIYKIE